MHKNMETNVFVFSMSDTKTVVLIKKKYFKNSMHFKIYIKCGQLQLGIKSKVKKIDTLFHVTPLLC